MWTLTVKFGELVVHVYTANTWQELEKIFASLLMCEEHAEPGYSWVYVVSTNEKSTDTTADWIGA